MKAVIGGKRYNTETAELLFEVGNDGAVSRRDFNWWTGDVYRTKGGAYFLAGEGHAASRFAERVGDAWGAGRGIQPLTEREALALAEQYADAKTVEECFGHLLEDARGPGRPEIGPAIKVRLPEDLLAALDAEAERQSASRAEIIRTMLWQQIYTMRTGKAYTEPVDAGMGTDAEEGI